MTDFTELIRALSASLSGADVIRRGVQDARAKARVAVSSADTDGTDLLLDALESIAAAIAGHDRNLNNIVLLLEALDDQLQQVVEATGVTLDPDRTRRAIESAAADLRDGDPGGEAE